MNTQNQIKRSLSEPKTIEYVSRLLETEEFSSRTELADFLCEEYGFHDPSGRKQRGGCLKGLRELEAKGWFQLPPPEIQKGGPSPRRLSEPVAEPEGVPGEVGEVAGLELVRVEQESQMRIWNELMIREHPQGAGPLVGRQVRYLVGSAHGWLGGFGFAAPALQLADRDRWIGWDAEQRRAHLHGVVCLSRFLIRPGVECRNLASRLSSMSLERLVGDFQQRYHYRPWLVESFVDTSRFSGASYRAANWILVGQTKGRGRQDRFTRREKTIKDIYVYPLEKDFRTRLGLAQGAGLGPLGPADGVDGHAWAEQEFGGAPLGDARLGRRLVNIAQSKAEKPGQAFTGVADGDWPAVKAYYRLIDHPDENAVNMGHILQPHRERTLRRMKAQRTVLCLQDGSDLDYTSLAQCDGLGVIGTNQTSAQSRGLHLHTTLAVAPNGLPLGVLRAECVAPKLKLPEEKRPSGAIPIEEKKTFSWIEGLRDSVDVAAQMPQTRLINVCDREADFFEMFEEQRRNPSVDLLVRAHHNRGITGEPFKLFESVRQASLQTKVEIPIPRQSARPKLSKKKARAKRPGRRAGLEVRYQRIQLCPPKYYADKDPIDIVIVHAVEPSPPEGAAPVEWFLLTTVQISSPEDAVQCLRWYCLRWRIEDFHRVLKSGCRIENIAHETAERIRRAIAINLVIAWRIMLMTLLGRQTAELPPEVLFSNIELQVLHAYAKKKGRELPSTLRDAVRLVARMGGYLARKSDPEPGHQLLWRGYLQLQLMCEGFALRDSEHQ
ncbi:MAG: IS4 family transposase [Verrucomicrobia bacterium]|nr:IS4 family transposase [Verrucomicrobiota bacterium]